MKKQTLVILAIIAVITTLLTVSALSNEVGYKLSPCDAIDISLENATVTDFLNATNMTTVQVYNFKGYKGENTWMVQWSSSNRLLDVYVNVATGNIAGIEKITVPEALKAWIVANYGDGTRVTSDGWRRLSDAEMANTLAPLPAGYTKASITEEVVIWAKNNPYYTVSGTQPTTYVSPTTTTHPVGGKDGKVPIIVYSADAAPCVLQLASYPGGAKYWIDGYPPGAHSGIAKDYTKGLSDYIQLSCGDHSIYAKIPGYEDVDVILTVGKGLSHFIIAPDMTSPVTTPTAGQPPEAIKNWIAVNYGDGTRVTSDGWLKLNVAKRDNTLAPLPAGYTRAAITEEVVLWALDNPNYTVSCTTTPPTTPPVEVPETICGWINSIGVTNLTEDHGLYVYDLAVGWTTVADRIYDTLSLKPSKLPAALATEDNGRAVYYYAMGWNTIANEITGCNFWTTPTSTRRLVDTVEIGVEIVGPTPTPTPETKTWHSVATFRDRSDKETPTFSIKGDIWCMVWQTVGCEDDSSILVTVYKDLGFMTFVDGFSGNGADTYCIYKGPGSYYLDIDTTALEYWEIIVEDYY